MRRSISLALILSTLAIVASPSAAPIAAQQSGMQRSKAQQSGTQQSRTKGQVDRAAPKRSRAAARQQYREARRFRHTKVDGETVQQRVRKLAQLRWFSSLAKAKAAARQQGKLVLWIHALGRIDGFL